jgi:GAF domain-containing protein
MHHTQLPVDFLDRLRDLLCTVRTEQLFMRTATTDDRLERIVALAAKQTSAEVGMLLLVHEDRGDLQVAAIVGEAIAPLRGRFVARTGMAGFAIDEGNPVAVADRPDTAQAEATGNRAGIGDEIDTLTGLITRNLVAVPVAVHGRMCGALELRNHPEPRGFAPEDVELATELAYLAAAAIEEFRGDRYLLSLFASAFPHVLGAAAPRQGHHTSDELADELERWLHELRQTPAWRRQVELAHKVRILCRFGDEAVHLADRLLDALVDRERSRDELTRRHMP